MRATVVFVSTLPPVSPSTLAVITAGAFFLFALSTVIYVVLLFIARLVEIDAAILRSMREMPGEVSAGLAPMLQQQQRRRRSRFGKSEESAGEFIPYDEERQYLQEELSRIQRQGDLPGVSLADFAEQANHLPEV